MGLVVKNPPANAGDLRNVGSIPGWGRSPGGGPGNPLWYSCLENPMDRGAWRSAVHTVANSQTRLSTHVPQKQKYVIFLKASFLTFPRLLACIHLLLNPCRHFTIHFLISFSLYFSLSP